VDHIGPDFERYENAVRPRLGREADGVIQQSLGGTNLDERRRQALKIGKENGNARILPLDASRYVSGGPDLSRQEPQANGSGPGHGQTILNSPREPRKNGSQADLFTIVRASKQRFRAVRSTGPCFAAPNHLRSGGCVLAAQIPSVLVEAFLQVEHDTHRKDLAEAWLSIDERSGTARSARS
jgi:hypothetical protein